MVRVAEESPHQAAVAELLRQSDAHAQALYPPESNHLVDVDTLAQPNVRFFVARLDGRAVGCGALVLGRPGKAEIKRMFVSEAARGKGVARAILAAIEAAAGRARVGKIRLETGIDSHAALALYRRFGYRERGPFGDYRPDPLSVFMQKKLPVNPPAS
ncbi:MAG: GNAT family N-acetyltransferase [Alphaproteobacteria bacterium]|nr:GNAT family N-acetyltransferase [Alphaproteobacteria bacterium]